MVTEEPAPTSSTCLNSTLAPWSASSFSIRTTAPSCTRYCLPPVAITAYMVQLQMGEPLGGPAKEPRIVRRQGFKVKPGPRRRASPHILRYHGAFDRALHDTRTDSRVGSCRLRGRRPGHQAALAQPSE